MPDAQLEQIAPMWDQLPDLTWKEKLAYLTYRFLQLPQVECPVVHLFENGAYIREMRIPAGALFLGRVHRHGHECQLISGKAIHFTEQGRILLEGPLGLRTTPGYQMAVYAVTDVVGRTIHPDHDSRDIQALEDDIFESVESLEKLGSSINKRLGHT